jgi:two-component system, OmpR family, alkaline phosphatase synthesis response regulator PhoP
MPHRILVVDDEAHILQVLSLKLRNAGYEVVTAIDGEEALDSALKQPPDVIITDFQMPYMTGLELCRALARNAATAGIPVLMLTARGHALDTEDLALGNIRDVLSKPFSPRAVVEQIQRLLDGVPHSRSGGPHSRRIADGGHAKSGRSCVCSSPQPRSEVA